MDIFFKDRIDAGKRLANKLLRYKSENAVVIGLPRGGVVVASEVAKALNLPLEIIVVRKISHKDNPEYAIGAVSEKGKVFLSNEAQLFVGEEWLNSEIQKEMIEAKRRRTEYAGGRPIADFTNKTVILVDDGAATGYSLMSALDTLKSRKPKEIIIAVPIVPKDTTEKLSKLVDRVVTVIVPEYFLGAIGAYYDEFEQVSDDEVKKILKVS